MMSTHKALAYVDRNSERRVRSLTCALKMTSPWYIDILSDSQSMGACPACGAMSPAALLRGLRGFMEASSTCEDIPSSP